MWAPLLSCYTLSSIVRVSEASFLLSKRAFAAIPLHVSFLSPSLSWALFSRTASQHVHTLLLLRFFVFAIKDTSTGISWCSTGLPSLFFLSWFNLKSELCSPLYLISSLPVSPLSRSVLSLSVGVGVQRLMNAKDSFLRPECGDSPKGPRAREMCVTLPLCEIWC